MRIENPIERKVLVVLKKLKKARIEDICKETKLDRDKVSRAIYWLINKGLVKIVEKKDYIIRRKSDNLPEYDLYKYLRENGAKSFKELSKSFRDLNILIGWLKKKDLIEIKNGIIYPKEFKETPDLKLFEMLSKGELRYSELSDELKRGFEMLKHRKEYVEIEEIVDRIYEITPSGEKLEIDLEERITRIDSDIIMKIREGKLSYEKLNVSEIDFVKKPVKVARIHPLRELIEEIREIFLGMGFEEISGKIVESSFWNFDALFVPQDHPAREMQDTFYLSKPEKISLDKRFVENVRIAHEGGIYSLGWRYKWNEELAEKALLRTHTTAVTIKYLAMNGNKEAKVFCIGRVYRKEKITYKHLPEFHQVEGIVVGNVTFRDLIGILKEFYKRLGFEKIRFRPSYFPYTEPSLEIEIFFERKNRWLELGGAGMFRPEVIRPFGVEYNVLAWGLGLERLLMLKYDIDDIRKIYFSDIDWLRNL